MTLVRKCGFVVKYKILSICGYKVIWNLSGKWKAPCMGTWVKVSAQEYKIVLVERTFCFHNWWEWERGRLILPRSVVEASYHDPGGKHIEYCTVHTTGLQQKI